MRKENERALSPSRIVVTGDEVLGLATVPLSGTALGDFAAVCRMSESMSVAPKDIDDLVSAVSALERFGIPHGLAALTASSFRALSPGAPERNGHFARLATACSVLSLAGFSAPVRIVPSLIYAEVLSSDGEWCATPSEYRTRQLAATNLRKAVIPEHDDLVVGLHVTKNGRTLRIGAAMAYRENLVTDHLSVLGPKSPEMTAVGVASLLRRIGGWLI